MNLRAEKVRQSPRRSPRVVAGALLVMLAGGTPMRLFHTSITFLTRTFAAVAVTAVLPRGHW